MTRLCLVVGLFLSCISTPIWAANFTPVATSSFTGADETPVMSEGSTWTDPGVALQSFRRISNHAEPNGTSSDAWAIYTGTSTNTDQYSRAKLTVTGTAGALSGIGLILRKANDNLKTYYRFVIDHAASNNAAITRHLSGFSGVSLVQWTQAFTDGDQFTFAIAGQVLYVFDKNGTQVAIFDDTAGGGPTTGFIGLGYSSSETSASLDDWEGGNFSVGRSRQALILE